MNTSEDRDDVPQVDGAAGTPEPDQEVPARPPDKVVPRLGGTHFETIGLSIQAHDPVAFEVYFQVPQDVIAFSVGRFEQFDCAYNDGPVKAMSALPYDMHFHPAGTTIYARAAAGQIGSVLAVNVDPAVRRAIESETRGEAVTPRVKLNIRTPQTAMLTDGFRRFMVSGGQGGRYVAESLATLAVSEAVQALSGSITGGQMYPLLGQRALTRTIDYIEASLHEDLRLADLAAIACLSAHHFSRAFKASTGRPPSVFILERRIDRAKQLLRTTREPLSSIALACGFSSQSHMTTAFRKMLNATPLQVRKEGA